MAIEAERWRAVLGRDPTAPFVYAVRTTRVYCRPWCPSRRPRREHVEFYEHATDARRQGFRACRRCRPDDDAATPGARVTAACRVIDAAPPGSVPMLADLARAVGGSPNGLRRSFVDVLGVTPKQYAAARRVERLRGELGAGADVTSALYRTGYGSSSRLYEQSDTRLGMTPASYRAGGAGVVIRFAIASTDLGRLLVATTERGVCRIALGGGEAELERELRAEFSRAEILRDEAGLVDVVAEVARRIAGLPPATGIPLDVQGTAFQLRVWQELQRIPRGETRSYGQLAADIGAAGAARAVGGACGANPVAIVVPCHRVIAADGGLGGYAWGVHVKRALLEGERDGHPEPS